MSPSKWVELTADFADECLLPPVDVSTLDDLASPHEVDEVAFNIYKEATGALNFVAHLATAESTDVGGLERNQAICVGLLIRVVKLMIGVIQLSAEVRRLEVVQILNRCILETTLNLEVLATRNDDALYRSFLESSFGAEKELYDLISENIRERHGVVLPIEDRMLKSISDKVTFVGLSIEEIPRGHAVWGGGLRNRLESIGLGDQYATFRTSSHAVHGTWPDLYQYNLDYDTTSGKFSPNNRWSVVDARSLTPTAIRALHSSRSYASTFFAGTELLEGLREGIADLIARAKAVDDRHEALLTATRQ